MMKTLILVLCLTIVYAQQPPKDVPFEYGYYPPRRLPYIYSGKPDETPKPYEFSYVAEAIGGQSTRKESADGSGRVVGTYTLNDEDGRSRVVDYVADEGGFRAVVKTNEPGTESKNPANVEMYSSAVISPHEYRQPVRVIPKPPVRVVEPPKPVATEPPVTVRPYYIPRHRQPYYRPRPYEGYHYA